MSRLDWNTVRDQLRAQDATRQAATEAEFWNDFRARARLVRQDGAGAPAEGHPRRWAWAGAATAFAAAMVAAGLLLLPVRTAPAGASAIRSLEVVAPHSGVIIMNDESGHGTILWVTGLNDSRSG